MRKIFKNLLRSWHLSPQNSREEETQNEDPLKILDAKLPMGSQIRLYIFGVLITPEFRHDFLRRRQLQNLPPPSLDDYAEEIAHQNPHIFGECSSWKIDNNILDSEAVYSEVKTYTPPKNICPRFKNFQILKEKEKTLKARFLRWLMHIAWIIFQGSNNGLHRFLEGLYNRSLLPWRGAMHEEFVDDYLSQ